MSGMELGDAAMHWEDACKLKDLTTLNCLGPEMEEAFVRFKEEAAQFLKGNQ
jgi:hypothetical protein